MRISRKNPILATLISCAAILAPLPSQAAIQGKGGQGSGIQTPSPPQVPDVRASGELGLPEDLLIAGSGRNIVLIIADDLGVEHVQCYGATESYPAHTPTITRLAECGVRFENAWAEPVCSPTRAAIYTGRYPFRTGIGRPVGIDPDVYLADDEVTIAEELSAAGYRSGLFGKWHLGADPDVAATAANELLAPLEQGFATHKGTFGGMLMDGEGYYNWTKVVDGEELEDPADKYATLVNARDAAGWINAVSAQGEPFLAVLAFNAPHSPWDELPPAATYTIPPWVQDELGDNAEEKYIFRAMIECLDYAIDDMLRRIPDDVLEDTIVVFVGDNGTAADVSNTFGSAEAKGSVYEGGVRVPFIVADGYYLVHGASGPHLGGISAPGRTEDALVHVVDLFSTFAGIAGEPGDSGVDSVSLVPYLQSAFASSQRETMMSEVFGSQDRKCIRDNTYKLVVEDTDNDPVTITEGASFELYDLEADPGEDDDLLDEETVSDAAQAAYEILLAELEDLIGS